MVAFKSVVNGYANMWDSCVIKPEDMPQAAAAAKRAMALKPVLIAAGEACGKPWWWIAGIIYREAGLNLTCYLGNGQPLDRVTTEVPKGRGPFNSFVDGCFDALNIQKFDGRVALTINLGEWTIEFALYASEEYNGEGYTLHNENSPYVWAGTNHEQPGLFTSDHGYVATAEDKRIGVAALIKALMAVDPTIVLIRSPREPLPAPIPGPITVPPPVPGPITAPPPVPTSGGPFPMPGIGGGSPAPVPTGNQGGTSGIVTNKIMLSIPGGPNMLLDFEHGVDSLLNVLPTLAMFVPQLGVALPFIPVIKAGMAMAEATTAEAAKGSGGDPFTAFAEHLHDFADQLASTLGKK
jgi:lysozyme family protein